MNLQQGQMNLLDLVRKAYNGECMLPDFQRNFVWTRYDIEELIKSLLQGMFIGTFLILETNPQSVPFKVIFVEGAEKVNPQICEQPKILILDGQQRLTSLFYAIYSPDIPLRNSENPYAFFIDLEKLAEDNIEDAVFSWSKKWREFKEIIDENGDYNLEVLKEKKILPLTVFKDIPEFYKLWFGEYKLLFEDKEANKIFAYIDNMIKYNIFTLSLGLSYNDKPDEIAALFEKINRSGVKLSIYDLLVARFYKFIRLREKWEEVFENSVNIKKLAGRIDNTTVPYSFIQALALAADKNISSREMLRIDNNILSDQSWTRVVDIAENKVLPYLLQVNNFGIVDFEKWLPYYPIVTMMIAFFLKFDHPDTDKIEKWYWSAVFSERYSGSTETAMAKDFKEVCAWFNNNNLIPEVVEKLRNQLESNVYTLKEVRRKGSSKYIGIFNLLFKNGAKDFYYPENIAFNQLDDHHIFPVSFLKAKGVEVDVDSIMNRTLIFENTNRSISRHSPGDYIRKMIEIQKSKGLSEQEAEHKVKEILKDHFIDEEMYLLLKNTTNNLTPSEIKENFERFINKREKLILNEIKRLIR
ncbi:Protein of unknown function DUF2081 [Caldicellulosiruptor hydrothermalis 108]|uniref:GmrSD restriction endonucleases N-terminal domain-containing protein n=1 Tax=Caldicellulosiruptor hydrothermalis (strain DSM 18901 / VKM B-2411 / 108) TaxID=632292 RepID=E4Q8V4_CALH1|nr:DUF262 domain-containing protein [Caldicellulosiruptor hydrothermalis]ADQ06873.1 Protein of unknown function DUF2081 [Caldicellulosiruptor hydrothermalis 108]